MAGFKDKASYKLGRLGRLVLFPGVRSELRDMMMEQGIIPAAKRAAQVCNDASSWGGYSATYGRNAAWVYASNAKDGERARRILTAVTGQIAYTTKSGKVRMATQAQIDNWTKGGK